MQCITLYRSQMLLHITMDTFFLFTYILKMKTNKNRILDKF